MATINSVTPETLANLIGSGVANVFKEAIKKKIREEFEVLVEAAANEVCSHVESFIESYREVRVNEFVVNLYINNKKKES